MSNSLDSELHGISEVEKKLFVFLTIYEILYQERIKTKAHTSFSQP